MRVKNLFLIALALGAVSCTTMNKYVAIESSLAEMRKDSLALAEQIAENNKRIDELVARTISLSRDTLRLYSDNAALKQSLDDNAERSRQEIARLTSQMNASSRKFSSNSNPDAGRVLKISSALNNSVKGVGEEMRLVLRNEKNTLYNIAYSDWAVSVTISDELLYDFVDIDGKKVPDKSKLSKGGLSIVAKVSKIIVEKANYDIVVREYVGVRSPELKYIPSSMFDDISEIETEKLELLIDSLMQKGILDFQKELVDLNIAFKEEDFNVDSLGLITPMANIKSKITEAEKNRIIEENKSKERTKDKYRHLMGNMKMKGGLNSNDRTSAIMRLLMNECYEKLGANTISKDATYVKMESKIEGDNGVVFIFRPKLTDLYKQIEK